MLLDIFMKLFYFGTAALVPAYRGSQVTVPLEIDPADNRPRVSVKFQNSDDSEVVLPLLFDTGADKIVVMHKGSRETTYLGDSALVTDSEDTFRFGSSGTGGSISVKGTVDEHVSIGEFSFEAQVSLASRISQGHVIGSGVFGARIDSQFSKSIEGPFTLIGGKSLVIGAVADEHCKQPMEYVDNQHANIWLMYGGVRLGATEEDQSTSMYWWIDTGASDITIPQWMIDDLRDRFVRVLGAKETPNPTLFTDCVDKIAGLPDIVFTLGSLEVVMSPSEYVVTIDITEKLGQLCMLRLVEHVVQPGYSLILGMPVLRKLAVVFDRVNERLGFCPVEADNKLELARLFVDDVMIRLARVMIEAEDQGHFMNDFAHRIRDTSSADTEEERDEINQDLERMIEELRARIDSEYVEDLPSISLEDLINETNDAARLLEESGLDGNTVPLLLPDESWTAAQRGRQLVNIRKLQKLIEERNEEDSHIFEKLQATVERAENQGHMVSTLYNDPATIEDARQRRQQIRWIRESITELEDKIKSEYIAPDSMPQVSYEDLVAEINDLRDRVRETGVSSGESFYIPDRSWNRAQLGRQMLHIREIRKRLEEKIAEEYKRMDLDSLPEVSFEEVVDETDDLVKRAAETGVSLSESYYIPDRSWNAAQRAKQLLHVRKLREILEQQIEEEYKDIDVDALPQVSFDEVNAETNDLISLIRESGSSTGGESYYFPDRLWNAAQRGRQIMNVRKIRSLVEKEIEEAHKFDGLDTDELVARLEEKMGEAAAKGVNINFPYTNPRDIPQPVARMREIEGIIKAIEDIPILIARYSN
jgi:hypothetical protein